MLGFKLIHVSKRGVWQATYCNMMVADVLMSTQKRTSVYQDSLCWHHWGPSVACLLLSFLIKPHNNEAPQHFYKEMLLVVTVCAPEALTASYVVRSSWTADLEKLVQCELCQLWTHEKCTPTEGVYRIVSLWLLPVMHAASTRFGPIRTHYCIQIQ